jgi:DNA-dependent RNA polymerase auxiliary subunit epsilon
MIKSKTASYKITQNTSVVEIIQLSSNKEVRVLSSELLKLLYGNIDFIQTLCGHKLEYNHKNKHLLIKKGNQINTYLTRDVDKKLIDYIKKSSQTEEYSIQSHDNNPQFSQNMTVDEYNLLSQQQEQEMNLYYQNSSSFQNQEWR